MAALNAKRIFLHPMENLTVEFYKKSIAEQIEATGAFEERTGLFRASRNPIFIDGDWGIDLKALMNLATTLNPDMIVAALDRKIDGERHAIILATTPEGFNEYRSRLTADDNAVIHMGEWQVFSAETPTDEPRESDLADSSLLN